MTQTAGMSGDVPPGGDVRRPSWRDAALASDTLLGAVVAVAGTAFFVSARGIAHPPQLVVGPGTLPTLIGAGLALLGLALMVQSLLRNLRGPLAEGPVTAGESAILDERRPGADAGVAVQVADASAPAEMSVPERAAGPTEAAAPAAGARRLRGGWRVLAAFALFAGYVLAFIPVGFLLSTAVFLFVMTTFAQPEKKVRNAIVAVVFTLVVYVAFIYGLGVYLPSGITPLPIF
ncbi:tripartite tricarboxylate transporter TctB family protein [Sediminivirga luteola]|uniref:DUF1468 domain-containing protein n=1 Tax=Sediminivirga luteola TaxID=1774748 RepID=A0A8J2XJS5_9MICO|nr:tripartite tricarboxylate transporter TctB family protein [Sediminivirga luteola]GGA22099.1 hypothetical protein GCM10011333_26440 [Sediminivirga luteola]